MRLKIKIALQQKGNFNETADGMDIALCKIDLTNRIILYSGAYSSLIKVSFSAENLVNRTIVSYSGIKTPIGIYLNEKEFFNTAIPFQPNDVFYMFSDGYMDQFGGTNGRKFLKKNFKDLLYTISPSSMEKQKELLETTFAAWLTGKYEQIDDILVVGLRLK
ncbi:MAG TPA: hypothetical protein DCQ31_01800 [Bacteroidales bacterium]|nr:hypothetical protein [Bacteroidales bacterium]